MSTMREGPVSRPKLLHVALIVVVFSVLVFPAMIARGGLGTEEFDARMYHLPTIRAMALRWPRADFVNPQEYRSASTPLYHYLQAAIFRATGGQVLALKLTNAAFGLVLVLLIYRVACAYCRASCALAMTFPALMCTYIIGSAIWITTDNLGLLLGFLALAITLSLPTRLLVIGIAGLVASAAVATRQVYVWTIAPLLIWCSLLTPPMAFVRKWLRVVLKSPPAWSSLVVAVLFCIPGIVVVIAFVKLWGGPIQEQFRAFHQGPNLAGVAFALAIAGLITPWLLFATTPEDQSLTNRIRNEIRASRKLIAFGAACAVLACVIVPTHYDEPSGRMTGVIWQVERRIPAVADRSLLFIPLAILGIVGIMLLVRRAANQGRFLQAALCVCGLLIWLPIQCQNKQIGARYFVPVILISVTWLGAMSLKPTALVRLRPLLILTSAFFIETLARTYAPIFEVRPKSPNFDARLPTDERQARVGDPPAMLSVTKAVNQIQQ